MYRTQVGEDNKMSLNTNEGNMERVFKFKREDPEQFHCLVKMHLSFILDMSTDECDCSFLYDHLHSNDHATPKRKGSILSTNKGVGVLSSSRKGVMEGATLTMEGVCQIFQIIQYLDRSGNIEQVGLFRKTGNLQKQKVLKERLNRGVPMDLDKGEFSVHECASVLKSFLSELPEPLLTERFFRAHCQVANTIIKYSPSLLHGSGSSSDAADTVTASDDTTSSTKLSETRDVHRTRSVESLRLLFLLIPDANYNLLKDMLQFLKRITLHEEKNKMSASNLGTIFATHLMCPRKLSAESLQSNHQLYASAVAFMIEHADVLFDVPNKVVQDVLAHSAKRALEEKEPPRPSQPAGGKNFAHSPVVNTIFSFVDRQRTKEVTSESTTDTALAELYAQVQAMPESAQKKRLISQLNDANGYGTPKVMRPLPSKGTHHVHVAETLENIKSWITPRSHRKTVSTINNGGSVQKGTKKEKPIGRTGSYSLKHKKHSEMMALNEQAVPHSFRKCVSEQQEDSSCNTIQISLDVPPPSDYFRPSQEIKSTTAEVIQKETSATMGKTRESKLDAVYLPPPSSTVSVRSIQRRAPPPVPQRVSSLKPKCDTPQSPCYEYSPAEEQIINGIAATSGVSSTPLPSAEDEEKDIFMETKSINLTNTGVRQKLNFLDVSYEDDISSDKGGNIGQDADNRNGNVNKLKQKTSNESSSSENHFFQNKRGEKTSEVHTPVAKTSGEPGEVDINLSGISTSSSNIWTEGEKILNGEVELSESMQLCLDGEVPQDETVLSVKNTSASDTTEIEEMPNVVGLKGMRGIENYLRASPRKCITTSTDNVLKTTSNKVDSVHSEEAQMSTSYAETVFALLNSPQPDILSTLNKENNQKLGSKQNNVEISSKKERKMTRKRSLTEMIGHNPLSKERHPLGEKRCFETDL